MAVNDQQEQDFIKNFLYTNHAGCTGLWTGGAAYLPRTSTSFAWHLGGGVTEQVTYFDWMNYNEPSVTDGSIYEEIIMLHRFVNYRWNDASTNLAETTWDGFKSLCFICEIAP